MFYKTIIFIVRVLATLLFKMKYEGLENIPRDQGFLLTGNHRTYIDPIFAVIKLPVPLHFMAKEELFNNRFFGWFISKVNAFPVARGKGDTGALDKAQEILDGGGSLLMFIEGGRAKGLKPGRPRSGTALMSARTGVGVVPMSLEYGEKLRFRGEVVVRYHPLITTEELAVDLDSPRSLRVASKKIMDVIISGLHNIPKEELNT